MNAHPAGPFVWRLSHVVDGGPRLALPGAHAPRRADRAVARANRAAAALGADDARAIFSARVAGALEGGRAAVLRPEHRRRLVGAAAGMGLRPFDANLIIAIVQDAARRGEAAQTSPLVCLMRAGDRRRSWRVPFSALAAATAAALVFAALRVWLG